MRALRSKSRTAERGNVGAIGRKEDRAAGRWGAAWGHRARATEIAEAAGRGGGGPSAAVCERLGDAGRMREETEEGGEEKKQRK